jgi:hypothetical protein
MGCVEDNRFYICVFRRWYSIMRSSASIPFVVAGGLFLGASVFVLVWCTTQVLL